jgi:hypothetical protein
VNISRSRSSDTLVVTGGSGESSAARLASPGAQRAIAPQPVDRAGARHGDDPGQRIARDAVALPPLDGRRERVLDRFLGQVPVAGGADQRRDRPAEVLAIEAVGQDAARSSVSPARAAYAS